MNLTASEKATLHFYEWEYLGRGYYHFDEMVNIEPPFIPFFHNSFRDDTYLDDGKVPSLFGRLSNLLINSKPKKEEYIAKQVKPNLAKATKKLVGFSFAFQKGQDISSVISNEFLNMLAYSQNSISFEIIGTYNNISVQFICDIEDRDRLQSHLKAYFPAIILKDIEVYNIGFDFNKTVAIVDFGLDDEFMRPIQTTNSFTIDSLTSIIATLNNLLYDDIALFQIQFQGVTAPWSKNILNAVSDGMGGSFFANAPEMITCAKNKISAPLFSVIIRTATQGNTDGRSQYLASELARSISSVSTSEYNKLIPLSNEGYAYEHHLSNLFERMSNRLEMILNSNELVSFVHYPNKSIVSSKLGIQGGKTKLVSNKYINQKYILGVNKHQNIETTVSIDDESRLRHTHIIGSTGVGKSTLIANMLLEDAEKGNGCAIFDPHGDIIDDILLRIPEHRKDDVILIDPSDLNFPIGFNLLQATTETEKIILSSDLVSAFKRHATVWGDKMSAVLSQAINTFLESDKGGTLIELKRFLLEDNFRKQFLESVEDPSIHYYWEHEYYMVKKGIAPLLTRMDTFLRPKIVRYMLAQKQGIDFAQCINEKKIVLIKLSQGLIGEENSYLLGSLFLSKFNQVAHARQSLVKEQRHPYYIYLDEFQNFITPSISTILSSARKYGLGLILAHQELAQIDDNKTLNSVISNPFIRICFRLGDNDAKKLESGFSYFEQSDLQGLNIGETIVRIGGNNNDFNMSTSRMPDIDYQTSSIIKEYIIQNARDNYAKPRAEIEELLINLLPKISRKVVSEKQDIEKKIVEVQKAVQKEKSPTPITENKPESFSSNFEEQKEKLLKNESTKEKIRKHKSVQNFIKKIAIQRGFKATLEEKVTDGFVDVGLQKNKTRIAIEISETNTKSYEVKNIIKSIKEGFTLIFMVSESDIHLKNIKELALKIIDKKHHKTLRFLNPNQVANELDKVEIKEKPKTRRILGYRVQTNYEEDTSYSTLKKEDEIAKMILSSMRKKK